MNTEKISKYHQAVHDTLGHSKERINGMMNEAWFPKKKNQGNLQTMSIDEVIKLTNTDKNYFLRILQMMVDILRLQYNREYVEDFGEPRAAHYVFEYDPNIQEITLYVSLRIRGISNNFLFQTSTTFRLDSSNKIVKAIGDEYLYMLALIGSKTEIHSKSDIRGIINSLPSGDASTARTVYRETQANGPAQGSAAVEAATSKDNTIRL